MHQTNEFTYSNVFAIEESALVSLAKTELCTYICFTTWTVDCQIVSRVKRIKKTPRNTTNHTLTKVCEMYNEIEPKTFFSNNEYRQTI